MHLTETEPQLAELIPGLDPAIAQLVHAMLRKKPAERPSVEEVAVALKRLLLDVRRPRAVAGAGASPGLGVSDPAHAAAFPRPRIWCGQYRAAHHRWHRLGPHPRLLVADRAAAGGAAVGRARRLLRPRIRSRPREASRARVGVTIRRCLRHGMGKQSAAMCRPRCSLLLRDVAGCPGSASTVPPPAAPDPDATPPIAHGESGHAGFCDHAQERRAGRPAGSTSLDRAARTMPMPMVSSRRPWPWGARSCQCRVALAVHSGALSPNSGPQPIGQKPVPPSRRSALVGAYPLGWARSARAKSPISRLRHPLGRRCPATGCRRRRSSSERGRRAAGRAPQQVPGSAPARSAKPALQRSAGRPAPGSASEGKADLKKSAHPVPIRRKPGAFCAAEQAVCRSPAFVAELCR